MRAFLLLCTLVTSLSACSEQPEPREAVVPETKQDAAFDAWLDDFRRDARAQGISNATLDDALVGIGYNSRVIRLDRKQPEGKLTLEQYLKKVINNHRIEKGRALYKEHATLLNEVSNKYGVPPQYIVALWGIETNYGSNMGSFSVVESLATLAYDGRRSKYFRGELINALKIIDNGHTDAYNMVGSWAGAMGQSQFMPSSFLSYAVDYNGDGKRDIWSSKPDVFASIANYLNRHGWSQNKKKNFDVIMKWNRSTYFATAVMQLADSIAQ
ncbi:MAG: lytic murein transglycosylase [Rickettsiales bacterium]